MQPALDIRPGFHFCHFDGEYVLLDLPAGRYFLIAGATALSFTHFLEHRSNAGERAILLEQKLICPTHTSDTTSIAMPPTATVSLIDRPFPKAPLLDTFLAIRHQRRASTDLRRQSIAEIARLLGEPARECSRSRPQERCLQTAAAFQRARRYVSAADQCLPRGIGLRRMLAGQGCEARLVFGVTLPFAAHCWVQIGETVLTDPLDVVLHYKPIFAV